MGPESQTRPGTWWFSTRRLAQAGLAVMRDTKELLRKRGVTIDLKAVEPWKDEEVWRMIASGNARGVHQVHFYL